MYDMVVDATQHRPYNIDASPSPRFRRRIAASTLLHRGVGVVNRLTFQHVAASTHGCCELIDILKKKKKSKTKYFKQRIEEEEQLVKTHLRQDGVSEWKKTFLPKSLAPMASCLEVKLELVKFSNHSTTALFS